jgi:hypothetical protein
MHNALGRVGFASSGVALKAKRMGEDPGTRPLKRRNSCSSGERATYRSIARDAQQRRGEKLREGVGFSAGLPARVPPSDFGSALRTKPSGDPGCFDCYSPVADNSLWKSSSISRLEPLDWGRGIEHTVGVCVRNVEVKSESRGHFLPCAASTETM